MKTPTFVMDTVSEGMPMDADGMPLPGAPPDIVERLINGEVSGEGFMVLGREMPKTGPDSEPSPTPEPGPPPSPEEIALAESTRVGSQFDSPFGNGARGRVVAVSGEPVFDPAVAEHASPIAPSDDAYAHVELPSTVPGSKFTPPFTPAHDLDSLREQMGTARSIVEGKRIRSASPCRTCMHGTEHFGLPEMRSASYAHIGRRIACKKFDADMTTQTILLCDDYEQNPAKVANFKTLRQIEKELRAKYGLSSPPKTMFDDEDLAEEEAFTKRALSFDPSVALEDVGDPTLWKPE